MEENSRAEANHESGRVVHQKAHGKEGAHCTLARGNDEVDRYVQQRRIVFVGIEKWDKTPKGKVVPKESVEEVVQAVHEALGHAGTMPTRKELEKQQLWVPGDQVRRILRDCEVCGRYDAGRRGQRVEGLTIKSTVPWGSVCMDVAGPMGVTGKKGEKYLLVLVDSMSGYVVIKPVRKANGSSVVGMLEQVCQSLGVPKELRTDNGTHFRQRSSGPMVSTEWGNQDLLTPLHTASQRSGGTNHWPSQELDWEECQHQRMEHQGPRDEKEVIQWKEVKNTCVVCSRPSTLTVQSGKDQGVKSRSKLTGPRARHLDPVGPYGGQDWSRQNAPANGMVGSSTTATAAPSRRGVDG
ncbi:hypothetical protein L3Q82_008586 [Scortum barcoo]|uniref:Uncharacterized protein n=1 Tax=Scortum barcoo TaxID=214431 RepID=A0ACB8XCV0_9TELE|nr:hypothetical protein L3Q82_008586 [Scortum barcoo]